MWNDDDEIPPVPPEFEDEVLARRRAALDRAAIEWSISIVCFALLWLVVRHTGGFASSAFALVVQCLVGGVVFVTWLRAMRGFRAVSVWNRRVNRIKAARCPWCEYPRAGLLSWDGCPECGMEPRVENL